MSKTFLWNIFRPYSKAFVTYMMPFLFKKFDYWIRGVKKVGLFHTLRKPTVLVSSSNSSPLNRLCRVLQGSVLGPILCEIISVVRDNSLGAWGDL